MRARRLYYRINFRAATIHSERIHASQTAIGLEPTSQCEGFFSYPTTALAFKFRLTSSGKSASHAGGRGFESLRTHYLFFNCFADIIRARRRSFETKATCYPVRLKAAVSKSHVHHELCRPVVT